MSGFDGEGLGIEIWGGCPRSLIEDNVLDHWLSVDQGTQSAVRRNVIGTDDGTLKGFGIEIIARDAVVTDNIVNRGAHIALSVCGTLFSARRLLWVGIATAAAAIGFFFVTTRVDLYATAVAVVVLGGLAVSLIQSFRYLRTYGSDR